jgi:hypothetical protein
MKNTMFLALMILAALPTSAQNAATPNCSASAETMPALAEEYAARVDGLLRDAHASLRSISERVDAGSMSPERARKLKLAVTRDVIYRLDAISAVYDVRLNKKGAIDNKTQASAGNPYAADQTTHATRHANGTISVEELKRETATALLTSRPAQVTR